MALIILVVWIVVMLLWLLSLLPGNATFGVYSNWLAFIAVLCIGLAVFVNSGVPKF